MSADPHADWPAVAAQGEVAYLKERVKILTDALARMRGRLERVDDLADEWYARDKAKPFMLDHVADLADELKGALGESE